MVVHFICRGNVFRSFIAEAYLKSLQIKNLKVLSSGTTAAQDKLSNSVHYQKVMELLQRHGLADFAKSDYADQLTQSRLDGSDIVVCVNSRVFEECKQLVTLPPKTIVWSVDDLGENGHNATTEQERDAFREETYQQIVKNVDELVKQKIIPR